METEWKIMDNDHKSFEQPVIMTANGQRLFACVPVAVQAVVVNNRKQILLLSSPSKNDDGSWQVVSGAMEAGETIIGAVMREAREELGGGISIRPLGTIHVDSFHYDRSVRFMVAVYYLLAYDGGVVVPGDDMARSQYRWWSVEELENEQVRVKVPPDQRLFSRSLDLYDLWISENYELQPDIDAVTDSND